ncbi:MAG: hypothetical protein JWQ71_3928 [Pedosphaera sp.]|nr:hypothetical protein [Pedosphaera sp.]
MRRLVVSQAPSADLFSQGDNHRPCENVCDLFEVFAWRVPRSSRVSRDLEKVLSRFGGLAVGVAVLRSTRLRTTAWKTGGSGVCARLVVSFFINRFFYGARV